ncbi:MAG: RNA polymerase sigma factor, partial [Planctomycetota bacterium]
CTGGGGGEGRGDYGGRRRSRRLLSTIPPFRRVPVREGRVHVAFRRLLRSQEGVLKPDRPAEVAPESLVAAVLRGDREGFESLLSIHRTALLHLCEREMDGRLRRVMEPEDVVQDVMLAAYRSISTVELANAWALRAWLEKIARNRLIDLCRRHLGPKRRDGQGRSLEESVGSGSDGGDLHLGDALPSPQRSPSSIVGGREEAEALEVVLSHIPPHFRALIRMVEVDQLSTAEIASRLGKSRGAVRKMLERALRACRSEMVREGRIRPYGEGRG